VVDGLAHDRLPDADRAGEAHAVDVAAVGERDAHLRTADDHVQHALGQLASSASSPRMIDVNGERGDGSSTVVHPAARAAPTFEAASISG